MANMATNMFKQAKDAVAQFTNSQNPTEQEKESARSVIQSAFTSASPAEQQQLQELERKLEQHNQLK
ncbi:DUF3813 family protein [Radiobacillus kanasensis]|uniref:DUF3813 family protein n=1 Tax=Radiobacillus kanasensis TaxID=2844358 RepID=UPI001E467D5E|nr:DUF3813 family protein [Radiobacillus kanasensis]UFU00545.1 DUF3813 family protein [Radiobacillus kanasensis]